MKNDGFTLFETLIWLLVICLFSIIVIVMGRKAFATSLINVNDISDNEIYLATEKYIESGKVRINASEICISTDKLKNSGYLRNTVGQNRYVEVKVNELTNIVEEMHIVNKCYQ